MKKKSQPKVDPLAWMRRARGTVVRVPRSFGRVVAVIEKRGLPVEIRVVLPSGEVGHFPPKFIRRALDGDTEVFNALFAQKMRQKEAEKILKK